MAYGQIVAFLTVMLILYYVAMILLDLQKAAKLASEAAANADEEIDISDIASDFETISVKRDKPAQPQSEKSDSSDDETGVSSLDSKELSNLPKEPSMLGAIPVEVLAEKIKNSNKGLPDDLKEVIAMSNEL